MTTPIVIQGTPVNNPHVVVTPAPTPARQSGGGGGASGFNEKQESGCRDPIFAVVFYACVIAIVAVAVKYGPDALKSTQDSNGDTTKNYTGYVVATIIIVVISFLAAGCGMAVLMCIPETLIKVSLIFTVIMAALWMVAAFASGQVFMGVLGLLMFGLTLCYAYAVWSRIPFATINLITACTAIRSNLGVTFYAYLLTAVAGVYSIVWSLAFVGVFNNSYTCNAKNVCTNPSYGLLFILFVAYFFGQQVFQNSIHVTCAGVVGHWWFEPSEANSCCSPAVNNAFIRTITTSFGSICFGSLIVAIIQALEMLAKTARQNDDMAILACIAECILSCIASLVEYFNKWAFIYVGLYGMGYCESGKQVITVFANRGWEAVIADNLVSNTLFLVSLVVGGIMGCIGLVVAVSSNLFDDAGGDQKSVAFTLGLVVGLVITSILMSTIGSAVNAVIVLFAEAPAEFQQNYPELSQRMRTIWNQVYPGSV